LTRHTPASRLLFDIASEQSGFFTSRQAREAGFRDSVHPYHVRAGNWVREHRGIYRLAQFPLPERPDLMLWQLWSRNRDGQTQGVYSHATALTLHELSDVMPAKLDMTVPPGFQRMATTPDALRLHRSRLNATDIATIAGVRVTTPLRTLTDVVAEGSLAQEHQLQAVEEAIRRGLVRRQHLATTAVSTRVRQRIDKVLKQVPDERPTTVRIRRSAAHGSRNAPARAVSARRR
jgi:predicted transcriptional regulator of viral defense system